MRPTLNRLYKKPLILWYFTGWLLGLSLMTLTQTGCSPAPGVIPISGVSEASETTQTAAQGSPVQDAAVTDDIQAASPNQTRDQTRDETEDQVAQRDDDRSNKKDDRSNKKLADENDNRSPFVHRIDVPDFPKDAVWLNTAGPLRKQDLRGKFVLLDFWTYCCINCMHILPELKKLERAFPDELVVIGVHSAKFDTEKDSKNIEDAIQRYEIEHPVVNDADHGVWNNYGVNSWPTVLLVDPEGYAIWGRSGEIRFDDVEPILKVGIDYYGKKGSLDKTPIRFELLAERQRPTALRFPGKVLADEKRQRLFIADSNHNRVVITDFQGKVIEVIGSGEVGNQDGDFAGARFDHPQGMFLLGDVLYLADTENHTLRKIDLKGRKVSTIAGTGIQNRGPWPGIAEGTTRLDQLPERFVGPPRETALNSPWDLWVHKNDLYIAMAGPHQIWKMPLDESEIGPYAGNGREDIVDGPLLPRSPYERGYSSFAQPSGLSSDGEYLFVADSEGSSIRAVPFDPKKEVQTVVGTSHLPGARLFTFGDVDGERDRVLLQHALGVAHQDGQLYVADTYNNKIKVVNAATGATRTLAGTGDPGRSDDPAEFDEPAGISIAGKVLYIADTNNHAIRTVEISTGKVSTLSITGLPEAKSTVATSKPGFRGAVQVQVNPVTAKPNQGKISLQVELQFAEGWKVNEMAPTGYWLEAVGDQGPIVRTALGNTKLDRPAATFEIPVSVQGTGKDVLKVSMRYYYCRSGGEGLCKVGSVVWTVPVQIDESGPNNPIRLAHKVDGK